VEKVASLALVVTLLIGTSVTPSNAQKATKSYDEAYRSRIAGINETIRRRQIRAECKAEAKKAYSAIHFQKRRTFLKECIARNNP
jgi:hypothetical protein